MFIFPPNLFVFKFWLLVVPWLFQGLVRFVLCSFSAHSGSRIYFLWGSGSSFVVSGVNVSNCWFLKAFVLVDGRAPNSLIRHSQTRQSKHEARRLLLIDYRVLKYRASVSPSFQPYVGIDTQQDIADINIPISKFVIRILQSKLSERAQSKVQCRLTYHSTGTVNTYQSQQCPPMLPNPSLYRYRYHRTMQVSGSKPAHSVCCLTSCIHK